MSAVMPSAERGRLLQPDHLWLLGPGVVAAVAWVLSGPIPLLVGSLWPARVALIVLALGGVATALTRQHLSSLGLAAAALVALLTARAVAEPVSLHGADHTNPRAHVDGAGMPVEAGAELPFTAPLVDVTRLLPQSGPGSDGASEARIGWGDGTTGAGTIRTMPDGRVVVEGTHRYADEGRYVVEVELVQSQGAAAASGGSVKLATVAKITRWDSARLLLRIMGILAAAGSVLVLLPAVLVRVVLSLAVLVHFGGILTAVTNVQGAAPWLSSMMWTHFYRPYLQFMYLNNAYHYYSPDPGPATLLWMRLDYGTHEGQRLWRWVKMPELKDGRPVRPDGTTLRPYVEYTRRLSLAEGINLGAPSQIPPNYLELQERRLNAELTRGVPRHPTIPLPQQYRPPSELTMGWIQSYVRHAARSFPHEAHPELPVRSVKVYRVIHDILAPEQFLAGVDPNDPTTFMPFYQGEFDADGRPTTGSLSDPLYGWLIPILRQRRQQDQPPSNAQPLARGSWNPAEYVLQDYLAFHAGDVKEPTGAKP